MENKTALFNRLMDNYFNSISNNKQRMLASRNLILLSEKEEFIDIAITLLLTCPLNADKTALLTCMVKDKFRFDYEILNAQKITGYQEILCQIAFKFCLTNRAIFHNISQSLALIYFNRITVSDAPLNQFLAKFAPKDETSIDIYNYYFKVLEECPQVAINSQVVVEEGMRKTAKERLQEQQMEVIMMLDSCVQSVWDDDLIKRHVNKTRVIECFASWIDFHYSRQVYSFLPTSTLLASTFAALQDQDLVQKATQCIGSIIENLKSPQQNPQLYQYLGSKLNCQLLPYINQKIAKRQLYVVEYLLNLVVHFSKKSINILIDNYSDEVKNYFMALVKYINLHIQKVVLNLLQFWEEALELFIKNRGKINLKIDIPIALFHAITQQIKYPSNFIKELQGFHQDKLGNEHEQAQQIYQYREESKSCFSYLAQLIGPTRYAQYVMSLINKVRQSQRGCFSELQSWLFGLIGAFKKFQSLNNHIYAIVDLYEDLTQATYIPVIVKKTFLRLFKAIFSITISDQTLVKKLFYYTISCFSDNMLISIASETFYKACKTNTAYLYNYLEEIFQLIKKNPFQADIIKGYVRLATFGPNSAYLFIFEVFQFLVLLTYEKPDRKSQCFQLMSHVFKEIKERQLEDTNEIFMELIKKYWRFIIDSIKVPQRGNEDQDKVIQRVVRLLKLVMRVVKLNFNVYLQDLFGTVIQSFKQYPICSYVYLVEIAISVYSLEPTLQNFLEIAYDQFTAAAFKHLKTSQSIDRYENLIEDFFGMNQRLLSSNTSIVVSSQHFKQLLDFITTDCLQTGSKRVAKSNYLFLHNLFMIFWSNQFMLDYKNGLDEEEKNSGKAIQPIIQSRDLYLQLNVFLLSELTVILKSMLQQLLMAPPQNIKDRILDTIISSIKAFPEANPQIWKPLLGDIPSYILVQSQKQNIINLMQLLRNSISNFALVKQLIRKIDHYLQIISRRMVTAEKRRKLKD